jgi:hypothetical protein
MVKKPITSQKAVPATHQLATQTGITSYLLPIRIPSPHHPQIPLAPNKLSHSHDHTLITGINLESLFPWTTYDQSPTASPHQLPTPLAPVKSSQVQARTPWYGTNLLEAFPPLSSKAQTPPGSPPPPTYTQRKITSYFSIVSHPTSPSFICPSPNISTKVTCPQGEPRSKNRTYNLAKSSF